MNPSYKLGKLFSTGENECISKNDFEKYLTLRSIEGLSKSWYNQCKQYLVKYLDFVSWRIDEDKTLSYCKELTVNNSITYYRKKIYQIRRFLEYLKVDWASDIKPPPEPEYYPKSITKEDIGRTLSYFKGHKFIKQIKALILIGASSGLRAEEMYQLTPEDIDIKKRIVHINHNPENGQTTKTKRSRIAFFNEKTQQALCEFLKYFNSGNDLKCLFTQSHITRIFSKSTLKVKDLRKYFSQEWDRHGGPTSIKKILMGHSIKGDTDLMHYNHQSEEDLKRIYNKVMS
ncbi:MAG: tyrosine-type recombinase/integrase [Thermoplasmatales archaeon]|nr:tyrosine-type recombinase/integrase [Thermoplasmatales archaeon]